MREIKFRIWDKLEQRFIFPDKGYQGHYTLDLNGRFHNLQNGSGGDEYIVQQYTGLKDSRDNDIYEGDIIETMYDVSCFKLKNGEILEGAEPGHFMIEKPVLSKVKWSGVGFDLGGKIQIGWRKKDAFKVVGNVFENSNLLS